MLKSLIVLGGLALIGGSVIATVSASAEKEITFSAEQVIRIHSEIEKCGNTERCEKSVVYFHTLNKQQPIDCPITYELGDIVKYPTWCEGRISTING